MRRIAVFVRDTLFREGLTSLLTSRGFDVVSSEDKADGAVVDSVGLTSREVEALAKRLPTVLLAEAGEHAKAPVARRVPPSGGSTALFEALQDLGGVLVRETRGAYGGVLTAREREVAGLVAQGMSNRRIASTLGMQEQSVKNLVSAIMRKMRCENRTQVALQLRASNRSGDA